MLQVLALAFAPLSIGSFTAPNGAQSGGGSHGASLADMRVLTEFKHALLTAHDLGQPINQPGDALVLGGGSASNYCTSSTHSFGGPALISATGSLDLSDGTFGLMTTGCPPVPESFGMYVFGPTQTTFPHPPLSNGTLCIVPFTSTRFTPQPLTASGIVASSMITNPAEFTAFTPGSTWNFQLWYRNPAAGNGNINLSDGLTVTFAP